MSVAFSRCSISWIPDAYKLTDQEGFAFESKTDSTRWNRRGSHT